MPVDLSNYTTVKERIDLFYQQFPEGRLVTDRVEMWLEVEPPRVVVKALAYRTPDDPLPAVGWSWMIVPGSSNFTRGSEIENTETSAWGRAIGALNIGIGNSIATTDEIEGKKDDGKPPPEKSVQESEGGLIGIASLGQRAETSGFFVDHPEGRSVGFVLGNGKDKVEVIAWGELAVQLQPLIETFIGQRVQVYGPVTLETMRVGKYDRRYPRLTLIQIKTPDFKLPMADTMTEPIWTEIAVTAGAAKPLIVDDSEAAAIIEAEKAEASRA